jgi:hypothetical protein
VKLPENDDAALIAAAILAKDGTHITTHDPDSGVNCGICALYEVVLTEIKRRAEPGPRFPWHAPVGQPKE